MHLSRLKLKNFGVKEEYEIELVNGLIVIRGGNGSGKSTIFTQGILYTFFGIQALQGTADDLANDNSPSSSMLVEAEYGPYLIQRSKSAAIVTRSDRKDFKLVGQTEVSDFFRDLFGVAKGAEKLVLVATQDDLAGILNSGPAATTAFIEQAAGFYQLDEILELAKATLKTYDTDQLEDQIETETLQVTEMDTVIVTNKSLLPGLSKEKEAMEATIATATNDKDHGTFVLTQLKVDLDSVNNNNLEFTTTRDKVSTAEAVVTNQKSELELLLLNKYPVMSQSDVAKVNSEIEKANELISERSRYEKFLVVLEGYNKLASVWSGSLEEFQSELFELKTTQSKINDEVLTLKAQLNAVTVTEVETVCRACNRAFDNAAELEEHNKSLETKRLELSNKLTDKLSAFSDINSQVNSYEVVNKSSWTLAYLGSEDFEKDLSTYPAKPVWVGEVPEPVGADYVNSRLKLLNDNSTTAVAKTKNESAIATKSDQLASAEKSLECIKSSFSMMVELPTDKLEAEIEATEKLLTEAAEKAVVAALDLKAIENEISVAEITIKSASAHKEYHTNQIAELNNKIKLSKRNQKYLSNMRKARLSVVNTIWKTVTDSVSHRFSEITGLNYTLVKEDKYFKCDTGVEKLRPVHRLSGSELVSLGIAFREVLNLLFAANCSFMVFDEPFASMSDERTASAMAAISNMVGQVFVITHEETSELSAKQLIEVV